MRNIVSPLDGIRSPFGRRLGNVFSPLSLFASNEPGGFYDFSDLSVMFQDAAGTTAAALEQPVGLVLDKSKELALGSELVTNGDFSNGTTGWATWNTNAQMSVSNGQMTITQPVGGNQVGVGNSVAYATVVGRTYQVSLDVISYVGAQPPQLRIGDFNGGLSTTIFLLLSGTGKRTGYFVANTTATFVNVATGSSAGDTITFDNISVRELPGNHLSQSTSTARPVLSARVNLLTRTEELSNAAWINGSISNGTRTNGSVSISNSEGYCYVRQNGTFDTALNYTASFEVTCDQTVSNVPIRVGDAYSLVNVTANVAQRVTLTACKTAAAYVEFGIDARDAIVPGGSNATGYTLTFNKIDLRPANAGVGLPAYQRVGAATYGVTNPSVVGGTADYDASGFPYYLKFDGTDDSLSSASIDFTSTDKMSVFAGVRKLSDVTQSMLVELSAAVVSNNGSYNLQAPRSTTNGRYAFIPKGTVSATVDADDNAYLSPNTSVVTGIASIGEDIARLRINGVQANENTSDQGTGNFGNYALYVGSRNSASLRFNGHLYSLIVRGAATDAATITATETWVNGKTNAYGPVTPNPLIWGSGNTLIWDTGNNITWGNS